jgi:ATP-binding cassette subfamily F protein 3
MKISNGKFEKMEAFIAQQKQWNRERNIIAAESRQKAIDRMEKIEKPKDLPGKIKISSEKA